MIEMNKRHFRPRVKPKKIGFYFCRYLGVHMSGDYDGTVRWTVAYRFKDGFEYASTTVIRGHDTPAGQAAQYLRKARANVWNEVRRIKG